MATGVKIEPETAESIVDMKAGQAWRWPGGGCGHGSRYGKGHGVAIESDIVPDSEQRGLIGALPKGMRPYASLIRLDRPIGAWLLFWPGAWAVALARMDGRIHVKRMVAHAALHGCLAMEAGPCVYNDRDRDPTGRGRAPSFGHGSGCVGARPGSCLWRENDRLAVLLQLGRVAQWIALASLAPVALYPFMKRITWWPQAWLGIVFSWAALVGWPAVTGTMTAAPLWLYAGSIFWVIGYDTIYALQDREDDALVGVKSSALALGRHARAGIAICYMLALACWAAAFAEVRQEAFALLGLVPAAIHFVWQVATLKPTNGDDALAKFRSNRFAGLLIFLACLVLGTA